MNWETILDAPRVSVYVPLGFPDMDASIACAKAALEAGASWLELGFPFSDPAADGPVIEAATQQALAQGTSYEDCLAAVQEIRESTEAPLVVMTYANVAYARGWGAFASEIRRAGANGCILPDVPLEESGPVRAALKVEDLAWVPLVTPATPLDRMKAIASTADAFLYVVSTLGITGQQAGPMETVLQAASQATGRPLALGFGIQSRDDVARAASLGASAIIGTHLVKQMNNLEAYTRSVQDLVEGTRAQQG